MDARDIGRGKQSQVLSQTMRTSDGKKWRLHHALLLDWRIIYLGSVLLIECKESSETGAAWPYSFCCALTLLVEGFDSTKLSVFRSVNSGGAKGLTELQGRQGKRSKRPNLNALKKRNNTRLPISLGICYIRMTATTRYP